MGSRAVRLHTGSPMLEDVKLPGEERMVKLLSLPLYATGQLDRLLKDAFGEHLSVGT